jgi:hypothetical protein
MQVSSAAVTEAFIARLQQVDRQLNCVSWDNFTEARAAATTADAEIEGIYSSNSGKKTKADDDQGLLDVALEMLEVNRPFLGVPFTCKESFSVKGEISTVRLVSSNQIKGQRYLKHVSSVLSSSQLLFTQTTAHFKYMKPGDDGNLCIQNKLSRIHLKLFDE